MTGRDTTALEEERDRTNAHIAQLQADVQRLENERTSTLRAIDQMLGRLRLLQEQLGEVPPMAPAPSD